MKVMRTKGRVAPLAFALFALLVGFYLLLGFPPKNNAVDAMAGVLDAELLQYFTVQAEYFAKEGSENPRAQP